MEEFDSDTCGAQAKRRKSFDPRCIVTDSRSQIIVTDVYNDCLHILHQNGSLHKYECMWNIYRPYGLSLDDKGRLWLGLPTTNEINVIDDMT